LLHDTKPVFDDGNADLLVSHLGNICAVREPMPNSVETFKPRGGGVARA
jgi:hypothetical protein